MPTRLLTISKAQLRLNAFFKKPAPSQEPLGSSRRGSTASVESRPSLAGSRAGSELPEQGLSEYDRAFPPFFLHAHTTLAPSSQYLCDAGRIQWALAQIGSNEAHSQESAIDLETRRKQRFDEAFLSALGSRKKRYIKQTAVKDIISEINGTAASPIDLTGLKSSISRTPLETLRTVPVKYLKYAEDVRPPYIGTYTKSPTGHSMPKLCRNPFTRALPTVNYDYDSEAEWEEPEEGEELNSEGEEEGDEDDEEDMEGFLDDGDVDTTGPKRRHIMGDIEPVCSGLHWESDSPTRATHVPFGSTKLDLAPFRLDSLLGTTHFQTTPPKLTNPADLTFPIDPYSASYWQAPDPAPDSSPLAALGSSNTMGPPSRTPLHTLKGPNHTSSLSAPTAVCDGALKPLPTFPPCNKVPATKGKSQGPSKPMPSDLLEDFKRAIDGSDLTKAGLVEVLKKRFVGHFPLLLPYLSIPSSPLAVPLSETLPS